MKNFLLSENALLQNARATYYPQPDGSLKLARVQVFSTPKFRPEGWETLNADKPGVSEDEPPTPEEDAPKNPVEAHLQRAVRRARRMAFDLIMCNGDLDAFTTLTYSPDAVDDKAAYDECYPYLRNWLSNGVQRRDLRYICVPELTKKGDIHFHAICNADALKMDPARNPNNGRLIKHNGDQVYNLTDWHAGFSTAQVVRRRNDGDDPREAVAKYIFKYMGKNLGAKIGGRYVLKGGKLAHPLFAYGDGVEQFIDAVPPSDEWSIELPDGGKYWEYNFLRGKEGKPNELVSLSSAREV